MTTRLIPLGLALLTLAVFAQVRHHEFVSYDDPIYITDNPNLADGLTPETLLRAFREPYETNWIPLTWISLHLDHALYGEKPAGYLLTNVALHAFSALLLFFALRRMTRAPWPSAFVAAVFAVHPLHVESVAWASERKDTLSGVFWMLTLVAYARYAEAPRIGRYLLVAGPFGLGLLAKPMLVTLPLVLLLLDYWPLGRLGLPQPRRALVMRAAMEKLPLLAISGLVSVVTFSVQRSLGAMDHGDALPFRVRLPNALLSYGHYLLDAFWPSGLAVFYPHLEAATPWSLAAASAVALAGITVAALRTAGTRPYLLTGWFWYLLTLIPVIGLVQVGMQARADRYTYVPLIGLAIALAFGVSNSVATRHRARRVAAWGAALAVGALAGVAWQQVGHWRDTHALYRHAVEVTHDNFFAHHGLAGELLQRERASEAEWHFREAARIKPGWPGAHIRLGDALSAQERYAEAIRAYEHGLRLAPRHARGQHGMARALAATGRESEAIGRYRHALQSAKGRERAGLHAHLGNLLAQRGEFDAAIAEYRAALNLEPELAEAHANLGFALLRAGRFGPARASLRRALELGSNASEVHASLGDAGRWLGQAGEAVHHYRAAYAGDASLPHVANNLAWILATSQDPALRDPDEAVRIAERAAGLSQPDSDATSDARVFDTLSVAYFEAGRRQDALLSASRALELAESQGDAALASRIRARLADFRQRGATGNSAP